MIDIQKSIELLRDDNNYYGEFGRQFMSNTDVKTLNDDPANFKQGSFDQEHLAKGRLTHVLLFEPHKIHTIKLSSAANRLTNAYKDECRAAGESYLLLKKDFEEMSQLVARVKENLEIYSLLFGPENKYEEPNVFSHKGLYWKTKADSLNPEYVVDFKTTGDLSRFKWASKEYFYDSQAYLYMMSYNRPVIFIVGEKGTGRLGVFECSGEFLASGEEKVRTALKNYEKYWDPKTRTEEATNYFIKQTL